MESPLKLSSPLSPYNLSLPESLKSLADDNRDFDLSKITTSFVSPTCSVKAASVNNFISSVSLPSVVRSLARVCLMENLFFLTKPDLRYYRYDYNYHYFILSAAPVLY